jgi:hypothetical protein
LIGSSSILKKVEDMNPMTAHQTSSLARTVLLFISLLTLLVFAGAAVSAEAQSARHPHPKRMTNNLLAEMQDAVKLVEAQPSAKAQRANVARNRSGTYEAFTLDVPIDGDENNVRETIFIQDRRRGKIYEVRGYEFPRPFADLAWTNETTLIFDQWMQPHYAVHYAIDVRRRKLVAAASFWERGFRP